MRKPRLWVVLLVCLVVVLAVFGAAYAYPFYTYQRIVSGITVRDVDFSAVPDGEYVGSCDAALVAATVRAVVRSGRLVDLELVEHRHHRGEAANVIPDRIFVEQRLDVDAVTGATNSSKIIQEALYNALTGRHSY